jgi:trehalose 6-phosphate phosphatase
MASEAAVVERALRPLRERAAECAVLSDYDGTLSPIVERPDEATLLDGVAEALAALVPRYALVGLISGRALAALTRMAPVPGLAYAGNHGMELRPSGEPERLADAAQAALPAMRAFAERWPPETLAPHGVWLEDKGVTMSFHFRTAPDPAAAERFLDEHVVPAARGAGLTVTGGRLIVEIRAPVAIDKGTATRALLEGSGARLAVWLGDDRTDLDGWRALRELREEGALEAAVCVGVIGAEVTAEVREAADVRVWGPEGALEALRLLA